MPHRRAVAAVLPIFGLLSALLLGGAPAVLAQTFTFETLPDNTSTPFALTRGGLTATFTAPTFPNSFLVFADGCPGYTGTACINGPFTDTQELVPLVIDFSRPLSGISLDFFVAIVNGGPPTRLTLEALRGTSVVGTVSSGGDRDVGDFNTGSLTFRGPAFDRVRLNWIYFGVTALRVTPSATTVPEPGTWASVAVGLLAIGSVARRRHTRTE